MGGLEKVVLDLVRARDPERFETEVCCLDGSGDLLPELESMGIPVTVLHLSEVGEAAVLPSLIRLLQERRIDIVHPHNPLPHKFGALGAWCAGVPVVVHTKNGRNFVKRPFEHPKVQVYGHLLSWITDRIGAVSDDVQDVARRYEWIPKAKLVSIWNGVDVQGYDVDVDRAALRRELGISEDARVVGIVARFVPETDHANLLRAFARVREVVPQAHLLAVGDGPLLDDAIALGKELGIGDRVAFAGRRHDVPAILKLFEVYALPTITEGTSISLLEAMSSGVPVIASAVGGNPELVTHRVSGLLCRPCDPEAMAAGIVELMSDPARASELALAARTKVLAEASLERASAEYGRLYDLLLAGKRRP